MTPPVSTFQQISFQVLAPSTSSSQRTCAVPCFLSCVFFIISSSVSLSSKASSPLVYPEALIKQHVLVWESKVIKKNDVNQWWCSVSCFASYILLQTIEQIKESSRGKKIFCPENSVACWGVTFNEKSLRKYINYIIDWFDHSVR